MKRSFRSKIRRLIRQLTGFDVHRVEPGRDAYADIERLIGKSGPIVVFDVGANVGQTTRALIDLFPSGEIHAFEPGRAAFDILHKTFSATENVKVNHLALGAAVGARPFYENASTDMSSFLQLGPQGWGAVLDQIEVGLSTLDAYCAEHNIQSIDLLKSDTQGFDLEVLRGGERMLRECRIRFIYLEITIAKIYENLPRLDHIYGFLADRGFELVAFYEFHYLNDRSAWTDALFARSDPP